MIKIKAVLINILEIFPLPFKLLVYFLALIGGIAEALFFLITRFIARWNDVIFIVFSILIIGLIFYYFLPRENLLSRSDTVQLAIFTATFFTLFYSTLLKNNAYKLRNKPILGLEFFRDEDTNYHQTIIDVNNILSIPAYYIRFTIKNNGKTALENVEVVVEKVEGNNSGRPFLPLNLHWAFGEAGYETRINIPQGLFRTIDVFQIMEPQATINLAQLLTNQSLPSNRYQALSTGFRTCTIEPTSMSDIYPYGDYYFFISISSGNAEPIFAKIRVESNGQWDIQTAIMRNNNFQVFIDKVSGNKELVFQ